MAKRKQKRADPADQQKVMAGEVMTLWLRGLDQMLTEYRAMDAWIKAAQVLQECGGKYRNLREDVQKVLDGMSKPGPGPAGEAVAEEKG